MQIEFDVDQFIQGLCKDAISGYKHYIGSATTGDLLQARPEYTVAMCMYNAVTEKSKLHPATVQALDKLVEMRELAEKLQQSKVKNK